MATILLIDDNAHIMKINEKALKMRGYEVLYANCISKASELLLFHDVDLIILDIMLPDGNGVEFCRKIKEKYGMPILFLSALGENNDVIAGLRAGADDYLAKPYDLEVLIARVEARIRNVVGAMQPKILKIGQLEMNQTAFVAKLNGKDLLLTPKEFAVLLVLVQNINCVVRKEDIFQCVWGTDIGVKETALWTVVSRLKKKLLPEVSGIVITLKKSEGYLLELL
ncbi:MAG: response regulator transcription factor [Eubacteriales bacterium]